MAVTMTRQDSRFYTEVLPNGLQMLGQFIPGVESVAALFWVKTGTRDEEAEQMGISHFLEHMAFKRTSQRSGEEIDRTFEEMGAEHNAGTWLDFTFYWARVLGENASWAIDVLADLTRPALKREDFEEERRVILEEIARYQDQPFHVLVSEFMRDFFDSHPLSREVLGTNETITALSIDEMLAYWRKRYGARNIIFSIAGNFDWDLIVEQVRALTAEWDRGESGRALSPAPFNPGFHMEQQEKFGQELIALGVPTVTVSDPRNYAAAVLATILGDETGSRLFWSLNQTGLAESVEAENALFDDNGLLLVTLSTEPEKAQQALDVTRSELKRLQDFDVTQDELDRAKAKLTSSVIIGGESTFERVMSLIRSWLAYGKLETLEETRQKIEAVTLDDLRNLVQEFPVAPKQVAAAVGPLPPGELN